MTRSPQIEAWPALPLEAWADTYATLQRWLQIVGKIRLSQTPWLNHSWHVTLYVTARGLTTSAIPYGDRSFQIDLDFIDHVLSVRCSDGASATLPLQGQSVASFYSALMAEMAKLGLNVTIYPIPNELADRVPFGEDGAHCSYDPEYAHRFWRILVQTERVFQQFRARFCGKCSPIHFFWGASDLAVTRFSGRRAPPHPGGIPNLPDWVTREAYSDEVSSCGFWPGGDPIGYPAFYAYAYPEPPGFADARIEPADAFYSADLHEFLLPYESVRQSASPEATLLAFLQSAYAAAADLGHWNRKALERDSDPRPGA